MSAPPGPEPTGIDRRAVRLGGIVISVVCVTAVVWWASRQDAPRLPDDAAGLIALVGSIAAYALATLLRGERWWRLLVRDGATPSRADAFGLTTVGYMGNNVLPARGGDAMRVLLARPRAGGTYRGVIGTLIAERVLDAVVLLGLFVALAYFVLDGISAPDGENVVLVAVAGIALAAVAGFWLYTARHRPFAQKVIGFAAPMTSATRDLRSSHGAQMAAMTVAIWAVEALTYWTAAAAVDLDMSGLEALYIVALASVFVLIPSGPGYLGTLDAAILFGARAIGASGPTSVSYLLILRFVLLVPITLVGLVLLLTRYGGWGSMRRVRLRAEA